MSMQLAKLMPYEASPRSFWSRVKSDFYYNRTLYFLALPVVAFYLLFNYVPIYGAIIAFKDFSPIQGIIHSPWIGFKNFSDFFSSYYFGRIIKNTFLISINSLLFGFPAPIILALLINELHNKYFSRAVQTITYMPHFISLVVICGLIRDFTAENGIINYLLGFLGWHPVAMLSQPGLFVPVYVISGIWQEIGWGSIIYLAALTGIDPQLYEAAKMDGAGRLRQIWHVALPGILPTILVMLILRMGNILNVGFEKIILLYNPAIYDTSDVISSFVYRKGLQEFNWSYSTAVGLFNSAINFGFLIVANWLSKRTKESSLW